MHTPNDQSQSYELPADLTAEGETLLLCLQDLYEHSEPFRGFVVAAHRIIKSRQGSQSTDDAYQAGRTLVSEASEDDEGVIGVSDLMWRAYRDGQALTVEDRTISPLEAVMAEANLAIVEDETHDLVESIAEELSSGLNPSRKSSLVDGRLQDEYTIVDGLPAATYDYIFCLIGEIDQARSSEEGWLSRQARMDVRSETERREREDKERQEAAERAWKIMRQHHLMHRLGMSQDDVSLN